MTALRRGTPRHFLRRGTSRHFLRALACVLVLLGLALALGAQGKQVRVVATTSWTAALAAAAGAQDVHTIAPSDLRHPAEYDMKPSDVAAISGADLIVSTGFEVMAKRLADAAGSRKVRILQVDADYSLGTLRRSIMAIAAVTGTEPQARASIAALEDFMASWKSDLGARGLAGAPVIVHIFQQPLAQELGFTVAGVFGPAPLEAAQISRLSAVKAALVIDNWHNEVAGPLRETVREACFASLINFPGPDGTVTLLDVLADNRKRLEAAALP
jgi:zinc transport system substrate-binding protein